MKVLSVIISALEFIEEYNLLEYLYSEGVNNTKYDRDKRLLLEAYNATLLTVTEYYPLSYTEKFIPVNGKVEFSAFTYNPYKIRKVLSKGSYKILPTKIECENEVAVTYCYLPVASSLNDDLVYENTPVSATVMVFGVLAEFLLYKNRFEESATFADKFINALSAVRKSKGLAKLKAREWF